MNNGIILDNIKHKIVKDGLTDGCDDCSLFNKCRLYTQGICFIFGSHHHFEIEE